MFGFFAGAGFKRKENEPAFFSYIFTLVSFEIDATVSRGILNKYVSRFPDLISRTALLPSRY